MGDDQRRVAVYAAVAHTVLAANSDHVDETRGLLDRVGLEAGVALAAAKLVRDLLELRHKTDALLSSSSARTPEAVELALASVDHALGYAELITPVVALGAALPGAGDPASVIERIASSALGMHTEMLNDWAPDQWPSRLALHAAGLMARALGPHAVPAGGSREQVIAHFLLDEVGALLLGCAARSPHPSHDDLQDLEAFDDAIGEDTAAEPLPLNRLLEIDPELSAEQVAALNAMVDALAVHPVTVDAQLEATCLVPALTSALGAIAHAAQHRQPASPQAASALAAAAASTAAGIEIYLTGRPADEALRAIRTAIRDDALAPPALFFGPVMRHNTLTELTGTIAHQARELTTQRFLDPDSDQIASWQTLRDQMLHLASVALKVGGPPG